MNSMRDGVRIARDKSARNMNAPLENGDEVDGTLRKIVRDLVSISRTRVWDLVGREENAGDQGH